MGKYDDRPPGQRIAGGLVDVHEQGLVNAGRVHGRAVGHARGHGHVGEYRPVVAPASSVNDGLGASHLGGSEQQGREEEEQCFHHKNGESWLANG